MSRVAVMGATGFLGRHVASALQEAGHDVEAVSRGQPEAMGDPGSRRLAAGEPLLAVVNCAGATRGTPDELQAANVDLVAAALRGLAGSQTLFVQIGSAAEYGSGQPGVPVSEDHPARPMTSYGSTKLAATTFVLESARAGLVPGVVLRVFNPVGAGASDELLPGRAARLMHEALRDGSPVRLGPLGATRDFVDARDVADAVVAAVVASDVNGRVLNIGSGSGATARELVELLAEAAGFSGPILEAQPDPAALEQVPWQVADISRARAHLGWAPRRSLREAAAQLWAGAVASATTSSKTDPS